MNVRAMISDFDGPINDSFFTGLSRLKIIAAMNGIEVGKEEVRKLVEFWGSYGPHLIRMGFGVAEDVARRIYRQWEIFDELSIVPLVPGAREVLLFNREKGILTTLLTSRNRENILKILEASGVKELIALVQTPQDWAITKPNPRTFEYTLNWLQGQHGISRSECVFIGDTSIDVRAGREAGIETFVVLTGPYWYQTGRRPVKNENILASIKGWPLWHELHCD